MKVVEIDIDKIPTPKVLAEEFKIHKLERGDQLRLVSSKVDDTDFLKLAIVMLAIIAINIFLNKKNIKYADVVLKDIFNKDVSDIKKDIKKEYDIEITVDAKEDAEQNLWNQFSKARLAKAYTIDEPEYDVNMVREPNPEYKK